MNEIALGDSTGHGEVLPKEERTPESHKPFSGIRAWFAEKLEALSLRSGDPKRLPTEEEMDRQTEEAGLKMRDPNYHSGMKTSKL